LIYKYPLKVSNITIPEGSRFLTVLKDRVYIELGKQPLVNCSIYNTVTGWDEDTHNDTYLGTTVESDYVWHWFIKMP